VIAYAKNVEKKPVTTISLNIGANDELAAVAVVEKEAKEFVEAKVKKVGKEAVEAKLKKVAEEAIGAKLKKVAEEAIAAKVNEAVYIKCSEKAFEETGGEEPAFEEARNKCLETEGKALGEAYYAENEAKLVKEGEEAAGKYFAENKATLEKEGKEAAEKYFGENKAKVEKEGEEAALKYAGEHFFELNTEGEIYGAELVGKLAPSLFAQIISNINGILVAVRNGGSLGLNGGKAVNYTGRIIYQGGYNPYGKQFNLAFEGVAFVAEHGGSGGPFAKVTGRCVVRGLTAKEEKEKIEAGCEASDLQPGFTSLVNTLNSAENNDVKTGFGACMSFPATRFNPLNGLLHSERMKAWTNMTNGTQTEIPPLTYNGPDIHPTPAGYKELAVEMLKVQASTCKKEGLPGF